MNTKGAPYFTARLRAANTALPPLVTMRLGIEAWISHPSQRLRNQSDMGLPPCPIHFLTIWRKKPPNFGRVWMT